MNNPDRAAGPRPITPPRGITAREQGLSGARAMARIGRSRSTILRWIAEGKLQAEIIARPQGPQYRINLSEAEVAALALPPRRGEGLTVREVAERIGRTPGTVRQWIHDGKLPVRVGEHPHGRYYDIAPEALVPRDAAQVHDAAELAVPERAALEGVMRELYTLRGILVDLVDDRPPGDETC